MCDDVLTIISFCVGIISMLFGAYAIYQANKINKDSDRINQDTKEMIILQTRTLEDIQKIIVRNIPNSSKINMKRDEFVLYKLKDYEEKNENNIKEILKVFRNLRIKENSYQFIKKFLEDPNRRDVKVDFFNFAETRNGLNILGVETALEKYGILMQVDFKATK